MKRWFLVFVLLVACTPQLPDPANVTPVTAVPTLDSSDNQELCQAATLRSRDWERTIEALELLRAQDMTCRDEPPVDVQLYTAYLGYGTELEQDGHVDAAREIYETALLLNPTGQEAQERLMWLAGNVSRPTDVPGLDCDESAAREAGAGLEAYKPTDGTFVELSDTTFMLDGEPFYIYGANYFPRDAPFHRFLTEADLQLVDNELSLMQASGLNTLRIFLYYDDLFACPGTNALPVADSVHRLDTIIQAAALHDFRLIVVLHQDADLTRTPLYSNPQHIQEQTRFLVERYRDEPAILAWDVRDRGDFDYRQSEFSREEVLTWLADTAVLIRDIDSNHPVTAGWWQDAEATAPLVDFVSFQFYGEYADLRQEIANLRASVDRPILLTGIGYSTFAIDEIAQRNLLYQAFEEVRHNDMLGWVVYMAFDYPRTATCVPPDCPGPGSALDHYGIWNTSYFPKLAVEAVEIVTGVADE